jgi:hypothetical protein
MFISLTTRHKFQGRIKEQEEITMNNESWEISFYQRPKFKLFSATIQHFRFNSLTQRWCIVAQTNIDGRDAEPNESYYGGFLCHVCGCK